MLTARPGGAIIPAMKTHKVDRDMPSKAERDLLALLDQMKDVRRQLSRMIRSVSAGSRHAVKDTKPSVEDRAAPKNVERDDVIEALKQFTIERGDSVWHVRPPETKLSPKVWSRIRQFMASNDIDWSTQRQAFVTEEDPTALIQALWMGKLRSRKQERQAFYTPADVAKQVVDVANVQGHTVLEPSAGDGALADACRARGANSVICCEIVPNEADKLIRKGYNTYVGDFMDAKFCVVYSRIVMNPPYTRDLYIMHVMHALTLLARGGRLVAIVPGERPSERLADLLDSTRGVTWGTRPLRPGAFKSSGTAIRTCVLIVDKAH